jgi:hypothetical protein
MNTPATVVKLNARGGPLVAPQKGRARPTNGSCTHVGGDPNTPEARRYRDLLAGYRDKLGREPDQVEETWLRTSASLALQHEVLARRLASGEWVDTADLTAVSSELRRVLSKLGIAGSGTPARRSRTFSDFLPASHKRIDAR